MEKIEIVNFGRRVEWKTEYKGTQRGGGLGWERSAKSADFGVCRHSITFCFHSNQT